MPEESLLTVNELRANYINRGVTVKAVNGVSFSVARGETFGIIGESGCGKSSLCRSITRLLPPEGKIVSGRVFYEGRDLLRLAEPQMEKVRGREIGMVFQDPATALNPVMPIREQLYEVFGRSVSKSEKRERSVELLRLVGIPEPEKRMDGYAHQFSGGMRQRVMIAIALAARPKLLLADEPTAALDATIQSQVMGLLEGLKSSLGMSLVLVTHDLAAAARMCDRAAVMYAGRVVELCDVYSLFDAPRHPYSHGLLASLPRESGEAPEPIPGSPPNLASLPNGCAFHPRCKYAEPVCREKQPELTETAPGRFARCHFRFEFSRRYSGSV